MNRTMAGNIVDEYSVIYSDNIVSLCSCAHVPVFINGSECWMLDNVVYGDEHVDCLASYDSSVQQDSMWQMCGKCLGSFEIDPIAFGFDNARHDMECDSLPLNEHGHFTSFHESSSEFVDDPAEDSTAKKKDSRKCSVDQCISNCKSYFTFPNVVGKDGKIDEVSSKRCKCWISVCQNPSLLNMPLTALYRRKFVCACHFENDQFTSTAKTRLKQVAVPSVIANSNCFMSNSSKKPEVKARTINHEAMGVCSTSVSGLVGAGSVVFEDLSLFDDQLNVIESSIMQCTTSKESDGRVGVLVEDYLEECNQFEVLSSADNVTKTVKKSKEKRKCSAKGCLSKEGVAYFKFPNFIKEGVIDVVQLLRCGQWLKYSAEVGLLSKPSSSLHHSHFLCENHFHISQFMSMSKKRLKPDAVPEVRPDCLTENEMRLFPVHGRDHINAVLTSDNFEHSDEIGSGFDCFQTKFETDLLALEWRICQNCNVKFFCEKTSKKKCIYTKPVCEKNKDFIVGDVPEALQDLTMIEEQLIARIHPIITIVKLKGHQLGYKGNVINFPQEVKEFASKLPHQISDINSVLTIRASRDLKPVDFQVRAKKVKAALEWLVQNNKYYHDVVISSENLQALPDDGNVFDEIMGVNIYNDNDPVLPEGDEDTGEEIFESGTPIMRNACEADQINATIDYPTIGSEAINEFNTDGYIVQAFPALFPTGSGDFNETHKKSISAINYFKHLMKYKDGRFAEHPRFRYFALNTYMRWSAIRNGNVFVKTHPDLVEMDLTNLKERLVQDPTLMKQIMFQSSSIHGSKAYWFARGKELMSMVEQLDLPTLFFTLSAADLHWKDLFKLLVPNENLDDISEFRRRKLVKDNPMIVDSFFLHRAEAFIEKVLMKKYKIKDIWFRIEYQHRGSPHLHGVLWMQDAPDLSNLKNMSAEERQNVVDYFSELVTAFHPNIDQPYSIHPSRKLLSEIVDLDADYAELLNKVQRHTKCSENYCLRKNKVTQQVQCRFKFPQPYQESAKLEENEFGEFEFTPKRNDERLNKHNRYMIQTWRANIDVAPVISKQALVNYLAKYITKCEYKSNQLIDIMSIINETQSSQQNKLAKHAIMRLYVKCCAERDFSAQETCHLLLGLKLFSAGGRPFVTINFNDQKGWKMLSKHSNSMNIIEKYQCRSASLEDKCLWEVAKYYKLPSEKPYTTKTAILQVYPKYSKNIVNSESNEKFYRQKVLLYVPWRLESDILGESTWKDIYEKNLMIINKNSQLLCNFQNIDPAEDELESDEQQADVTVEEWMAISSMGPSQHVEKVDLGNRDVDMSFDWHSSSCLYGPSHEIVNFIASKKTEIELEESVILTATTEDAIVLNEEQSQIINLVQKQIDMLKVDNIFDGVNHKVPQKCIVQGKAGTGKSIVIKKMTDLIQKTFGYGAYLLLGPTGVSAININGCTIHSALRIRPNEFCQLNGAALHEFKEHILNVKFVIIDEYSMVGCDMLYKIDSRLRQGKDMPSAEFGSVFIYMFGDINQLPCIADCPAYSILPKSMESINGSVLYHNFDAAFFLNTIHRQKDTVFQNILNNIANGSVTVDDYNILKSRFSTSVSSEVRKEYGDILHLYPRRLQVDSFNKCKLENCKEPGSNARVPVARIPAKLSDSKFASSAALKSDVLEPVLYLSKGCRVMLRWNLWTKQGLVNGAMGEVVDIIYDPDSTPHEDLPIAVLCKFDSYKGPEMCKGGIKFVPILPIQKTLICDGVKFTVCQFPISLCYGCTIHKSQGITVDKVYVDIDKKEMKPGLTYVALSRVKSLDGLLLEPFLLSRLLSINHSSAHKWKQKWLEYLKRLSVSKL